MILHFSRGITARGVCIDNCIMPPIHDIPTVSSFMGMPEGRKCTKCGLKGPKVVFQVIQRSDRKHPSIVQPCKTCRSKKRKQIYWRDPKQARTASKNWRKRNTDYNKQRQKEYCQKKRMEVLSHYGFKCKCCDENQEVFLTIDHIDNDGSSHRNKLKSSGGVRFYIWIIRSRFPTNLQILCWNCNLAKAQRGMCPHEMARRQQSQGHNETDDSQSPKNGMDPSTHSHT